MGHRCDADEEQSYLSLMKSAGDAGLEMLGVSCPDNSKKPDVGDAVEALGDDITALDDASVVSFKKVTFTENVSIKTEKKYAEIDDINDPTVDSTEGNDEEKVENDIGDDSISWSLESIDNKDFDAWDLFKNIRLVHNNLWVKYSLVRDGASIQMLLLRMRRSSGVFIAIETTDRDVIGCLTSPWKKTSGYFGTGECFV